MNAHPLRVEREARGWSQAKIAEILGISTRTVMRWEQKQALPYPIYRERLCTIFGKSARELGILSEEDQGEFDSQVASAQPPAYLPANAPSSLNDPAIPQTLGQARSLQGRDALLNEIRHSLLSINEHSCTVLQGLPGVGKTALATALALDKHIHERYPEGILWAGLGQQPDTLNILARWGKFLGASAADIAKTNSLDAWHKLLKGIISQRRMLLVIDDVWNSDDVKYLQVGGPRCMLLMTTRLPNVASILAPDQVIPVPELTEEDGLALLTQFAPALARQNSAEARELVQLTGALPLALTIIGKTLAAQNFTHQPRRLQTALQQLRHRQRRLNTSIPVTWAERPPNLPPSVPLSLESAITVSFQQLNPQAQTMLHALTVFPPKPNTFSEEALLAVSQQPIESLDSLYDYGLVESSAPGRYTLHQTIYDYARHVESTNTQVDASTNLEQAFVSYILSYLQTHEQQYDALEGEITNILAALHVAHTRNLHQAFLQGVLHLVPFMRIRGLYSQADQYLQQALQAAQQTQDPIGRTTILCHLASFAELRGEFTQAQEYSQEGLTLARQLGLREATGDLLRALGLALSDLGNYTQAEGYFEESLQIARQLDDPNRVGLLLMYLGRTMRYLGKYERSQVLYREGLALARKNDNLELQSNLLGYLGGIAQKQGHSDQAERYCQEALTLARQLGYRESQCVQLNYLGLIEHQRKHYARAETYFQEALTLGRQISHIPQVCWILLNLALLAAARDNYSQAKIYIEESLALARQIQSTWFIGSALMSSGTIHLQFQALDAASAAYEEVLSIYSTAERAPEVVGQSKYGLARIAALRGDHTMALELGKQSVALLEAVGHYEAPNARKWLTTLVSQLDALPPAAKATDSV